MYTPNSIDVFIAAYAGCLGGMRSQRNVSQNTNPAHYDHLCRVALAFAESFDTEYASVLPNDLQLADIESVCSEQMNGRQPGGSGPTTTAFWTKPVLAIIALLSEADSIVAANITTPIPFPSPPAGIPVIQIATVSGVADSLKSTTPATNIVAMVDGYYAKGDDGGGPFYWLTTSTATDDGGSVINPTGHVGAGRWIRIISGNRYSVRWWGAKGDGFYTVATIGALSFTATIAGLTSTAIGMGILIAGAGAGGQPLRTTITNVVGTNVSLANPSVGGVVGGATFIATNDTAKIQAAASYVTASLITLAGGVGMLGAGGLYGTLGCWFDCGFYYITSAITCQGSFFGDTNAAIVQGDPTENIFELTGAGQTVTGFALGGGLSSIDIQTPPNVPCVITISQCSIRYPFGPAVRQDTTLGPGYQRAADFQVVIQGCSFEGQALFWGEIDNAVIQDCFLFFVTGASGGPPLLLDDDGHPMALINFGDTVRLANLAMAPSVPGANISWIVGMGQGNLYLDNVRFGGEDALPAIRLRDSHYLGQPLTFDAGAMNLQFKGCAMASFASKNWLEIYADQEFPTVIDVRSTSPTTASSVGASVSFVSSWGVWIETGLDMQAVADRNKAACLIHLDGFVQPSGGYRFRQSATPTNTIGTDVWNYLRQFADTEPLQFANLIYPSDAAPKDNLYVPNVYDLAQYDAAGSIAAHLQFAALDYSSGYPLSPIESDGTGTQASRLISKVLGTVANGAWGAGFTPGEYCFSFYVKPNWAGEMVITRKTSGQTIATRLMVQADVWQRVSLMFWHDGTGSDFEWQVQNWPDTGVAIVGLFMVNTGTVPAPYVFPKGSTTAVAAITLPVASATGNTGLNWVGRSAYVRQAVPVAGVYVKGDKIYYPEPAPGGFIGAVCTTAGVVGAGAAFKEFGYVDNGGFITAGIVEAASGAAHPATITNVLGFAGLWANNAPGIGDYMILSDNTTTYLQAPGLGGAINIGHGGAGNLWAVITRAAGWVTKLLRYETPAVIPDAPAGGTIGTAATTVDVYNHVVVSQTSGGQTRTVPDPTDGTSGLVFYVSSNNGMGNVAFALTGTGLNVAAVNPGETQGMMWTGAAWSKIV